MAPLRKFFLLFVAPGAGLPIIDGFWDVYPTGERHVQVSCQGDDKWFVFFTQFGKPFFGGTFIM